MGAQRQAPGPEAPARKGEPQPLEWLHLMRGLTVDYRELLPAMAPDEQRRIRGEQDVIVPAVGK